MAVPSHREWAYNRLLPERRGLTYEFFERVEGFLQYAGTLPQYRRGVTTVCPCPCLRCRGSGNLSTEDEVRKHLYNHGFNDGYGRRTNFGEGQAPDDVGGTRDVGGAADPMYNHTYRVLLTHSDKPGGYESDSTGNGTIAAQEQAVEDESDEYELREDDESDGYESNEAAREKAAEDEPDEDEPSEEDVHELYDMLRECDKPLYPGCQHSPLSLSVKFVNIKLSSNLPRAAADGMLELSRKFLPDGSRVPNNYRAAEKLAVSYRRWSRSRSGPNTVSRIWRTTPRSST